MRSFPGSHIMDYAPALRIRGKNMLFESSDGVGGNIELIVVDTHLRTATVGTLVASIYSLLLVVSDVPSRNRGDRTRMNNMKTDGPSVPPC